MTKSRQVKKNTIVFFLGIIIPGIVYMQNIM